jgi:hypothetical protein
MVDQFIPLYFALFFGSMAAGVGALYLSMRLHAQKVRVRVDRGRG